ncbi:hypothetical protein CDAR_552171 [Caerostris darwini]|uniref:Uncharacterized protein n=1 Tax=Caerostris darwini TaxID=1538125 RepID=A0AAV4NIL5_9ARAC|nr:hypothetical protein CDAR_552171 [Caerostris darwini]
MDNTCPVVHSGISKPDSIGIFDPLDRWRSLNAQNNGCLGNTRTQDEKKTYVLMRDWFAVSLDPVLDIWLHVVHAPLLTFLFVAADVHHDVRLTLAYGFLLPYAFQ